MKRRLQLDIPFVLIQQIRAAHALAESAFEISIRSEETHKFGALKDAFGLHFASASPGDFVLTPFLRISHTEPLTAIGALQRPLIFPRAIAEHCRSLWPSSRDFRYSFAGLLTDKRKQLLERWTEHHAGARCDQSRRSRGLWDLMRRHVLWWKADERRQIGSVTLWSSRRGRRFPTKAWDDEYYRLLASSHFVLCPSGDYVWSYRFFEAILCGAAPIVEQSCEAYEGFRFRTLADDGGDLEWSAADAAYNYQLCCERIVLPGQALNDELHRLVGAA